MQTLRSLWRREGDGYCCGSEEGVSTEEDSDVVVHLQRNPGLNGLSMRNNVVKMARLKHELKAAPAYAYYFTWQTPILDGVPGAWHTAELQFCFDNTKRCEQGTGNTPGGAGAGEEDGVVVGGICSDGKPEH